MFPAIQRRAWLCFVPLRWVSPAPLLAFLVAFFFVSSTGIQVQGLSHVAAGNSRPPPRWPRSLCSNQSSLQEIRDSVLLSQLRGVSQHKNGLVTSKATRFVVAKEGKGYSSGPYKSSVS